MILAVLASTKEGIDKINKKINKDDNYFLDVIANDEINEKLYTFSETSLIFKDKILRDSAKDRLATIGEPLFPHNSLGYRDMALTIAFAHNTPDNTLPIIWKKNEEWQPLFKRHEK